MTATAAVIRDFNSFHRPPVNTGVSPASSELLQFYATAIAHLIKPANRAIPLERLLRALDEVYERCSDDRWDGYDALPITEAVYRQAQTIIMLLPLSYPLPEILPEPTGEIAFEWYRGPRRVLVISVGEADLVTYAGLFGPNKVSGVEQFSLSLPKAIIESLARVYRQ